MPSTPEAIPAATLVVMRDAAAGPPELLMIERGAAMAFAPGALVFPGGRIEAADHALAAADGGSDGDGEDAAARVAAIRETIEEVGIAVGLIPAPTPAAADALRAGLAAGTPFAALLAQAGLAIDASALRPLARWLPPLAVSRRFDTRFYLARAPAGAVALADGGESVRAVWTTAAAALADADAGHHRIMFPTRRNLERIALAGSWHAACADAAARPIVTITPWIEQRDGADWLCIPAGQGYPVTAERLATATRG